MRIRIAARQSFARERVRRVIIVAARRPKSRRHPRSRSAPGSAPDRLRLGALARVEFVLCFLFCLALAHDGSVSVWIFTAVVGRVGSIEMGRPTGAA
jgi:hypothetical protein